jgi:hypothetical protein
MQSPVLKGAVLHNQHYESEEVERRLMTALLHKHTEHLEAAPDISPLSLGVAAHSGVSKLQVGGLRLYGRWRRGVILHIDNLM